MYAARPPERFYDRRVRAVVTGGLGFLGRALGERLRARGEEVVVYDALQGDDICDHDRLAGLLAPGDVVFHLAGVRGGQAEQDFELALRVNLEGTRAVLEACRASGDVRLVLASTVAVFGGSTTPPVVDESTRPNPQTTYGTTKAMAELLLADYRRKGYVDGRAGRLATVIVRPDAPAQAASGFASAVFREALAARDYDLPVGLETRLAVVGTRTAVACLARLAELPASALADQPVLNLPSLSVEVGELVAAARRIGTGGTVRVRPDPAVDAVVGTWPRAVGADRALDLGFPRDESLDAIASDYAATVDG
jgi:nucleoside-diphosphate-sugar epimerase